MPIIKLFQGFVPCAHFRWLHQRLFIFKHYRAFNQEFKMMILPCHAQRSTVAGVFAVVEFINPATLHDIFLATNARIKNE